MLGVALIVAGLLTAISPSPWLIAELMIVAAVIALGYTVPPLKLSYRTLGEIDVGVTHSSFPILYGFVLQSGSIADPEPWLISVPLFLSILPAIILSGIPDYDADQAVHKATIAVRFGIRNAFVIAAVFSILAAMAAVVVHFQLVPGVYGLLTIVFIALHAALIVRCLIWEMNEAPAARRIDGSMMISLSFILWFCIAPIATL